MIPVCNARSYSTVLMLSLAVSSMCPPVRALQQPGAEPETPLPSAIHGRWQVTQVLVDPEQFKPSYDVNDARIKGRLLKITADTITQDLSGWVSICVSPVVSRQRMTARSLIETTMSNVRNEGLPAPEDYQLPLASGTDVEVLWLRCELSGHVGPSGPPGRKGFNWLLLLPDGRLAVRWAGWGTIAVLTRLPANTMPNPSFDCAKAATPTEKTICGSVDLAAFDRSVAEAYAKAVARRKKKGDSEGLQKLEKEQMKSLRERNACGTDEECLRQSMSLRTEAIVDPPDR